MRFKATVLEGPLKSSQHVVGHAASGGKGTDRLNPDEQSEEPCGRKGLRPGRGPETNGMMPRASWPSASHRSRPMGLFAALTARRAHSSRVLPDQTGRRSETDRSAVADRAENTGTTSDALMGRRHCGPILTDRPVHGEYGSTPSSGQASVLGRPTPTVVCARGLEYARGGHRPQIVVPNS